MQVVFQQAAPKEKFLRLLDIETVHHNKLVLGIQARYGGVGIFLCFLVFAAYKSKTQGQKQNNQSFLHKYTPIIIFKSQTPVENAIRLSTGTYSVSTKHMDYCEKISIFINFCIVKSVDTKAITAKVCPIKSKITPYCRNLIISTIHSISTGISCIH